VQVAALVDGNAADAELDVLAFTRVEAAQEDLLGVALAALVGEQDARRELQELRRVGVRHARELAGAQVEVGRTAARRCLPSGDEDFFVFGRGLSFRRGA
jgi:hypothetical protein